jgi:hypothetical protein
MQFYIFYNFQASLNHIANACSCLINILDVDILTVGNLDVDKGTSHLALNSSNRLFDSQPAKKNQLPRWPQQISTFRLIKNADELFYCFPRFFAPSENFFRAKFKSP